jgi:hypothetical protein
MYWSLYILTSLDTAQTTRVPRTAHLRLSPTPSHHSHVRTIHVDPDGPSHGATWALRRRSRRRRRRGCGELPTWRFPHLLLHPPILPFYT